MDDFIKAMQIFRRYGNPKYPFYCEHDTLHVHVVKPCNVSEEDRELLEGLGFYPDCEDFLEDASHFYSFRYGSC